jgi:hypothetical protein
LIQAKDFCRKWDTIWCRMRPHGGWAISQRWSYKLKCGDLGYEAGRLYHKFHCMAYLIGDGPTGTRWRRWDLRKSVGTLHKVMIDWWCRLGSRPVHMLWWGDGWSGNNAGVRLADAVADLGDMRYDYLAYLKCCRQPTRHHCELRPTAGHLRAVYMGGTLT